MLASLHVASTPGRRRVLSCGLEIALTHTRDLTAIKNLRDLLLQKCVSSFSDPTARGLIAMFIG